MAIRILHVVSVLCMCHINISNHKLNNDMYTIIYLLIPLLSQHLYYKLKEENVGLSLKNGLLLL